MSSANSEPASDATLFANIDSYPWDSDAEFQGGLLAILGSDPAPQQANELALRARCFYYERGEEILEAHDYNMAILTRLPTCASSKFNVSVDFNAYKEWREKNGIRAPSGPTNHRDDVCGIEPAHSEALPGIAPFPLGANNNTSGEENKEDEGGNTVNSTGGAAPYPTSFAHIVELITSGKPIPGIKDIPGTILSGQGTESKRERRKKPWESQDM